MKRAICALLAVLCLFACSACGLSKSDNPFFGDLSGEKAATHIKTVVDYTYKDSMNTTTVLSGEYSTKISGENSITEFSYERYAEIGETENVTDGIKTVSGTIYKKDGKITTKGDVLDNADVTEGFNLRVNLSADTLDEYQISEDKKLMTAKVSGENIAKALGVALKANGAVSIALKSDGTNVLSMDISYTTVKGATVLIRTTYAYGEVALDFGA